MVENRNSSEESSRTTDRAVRSLIKLFNIDDEGWQSDMAQVEKLLESVKDNHAMANTCEGGRDDLVQENMDEAPGVEH